MGFNVSVKPTQGGGGSVTENQYSAENKDAGSLSIGMVVAVHSSGVGVVKARADSLGTRAVGLSLTSTAPTVAATIQTDGIVDIANWTAATGSATLSANAVYFLDPTTAGMMTTTAPTTTGQHVQRIGTAVSTTKLYLEIEQPILL